ncbi:hypothetical protein EV715DRAFT_277188 [Schizophyllum commune]
MSSQNVLILGGSKNIGYYAAVRLLDAGATVTFMLRNTAAFDADPVLQRNIGAGKACLVQGDGLKQDDVARAWAEAAKDRPVDTLLSTVGGTPKFSLTKGFLTEPHNLRSHASLPCVFKPFYAHALAVPHRDKLGVERVLAHCAGFPWDEGEPEPAEDIVGANWRERKGLPAAGELQKVLIVRPALLTDGECEADKGMAQPYRASEEELGGYTVSRKDVGHFIAKAILADWEKYEGKIINVGY